jgi:hypothetical protein
MPCGWRPGCRSLRLRAQLCFDRGNVFQYWRTNLDDACAGSFAPQISGWNDSDGRSPWYSRTVLGLRPWQTRTRPGGPAGFEHFFNELGEQMAAAKAVSVAAVPDLAGLGARYGHYFQPESIARLCRQHGLVYPA